MAPAAPCGWLSREEIKGDDTRADEAGKRVTFPWIPLLAVAALIASSFWLKMSAPYLLVGVGLLWVALRWRDHAWHVAVTLTFSAFALDLAEFFVAQNLGRPWIGWSFAVVSAVAVFYLVLLRQRNGNPLAAWSFIFLTWTAVAVSLAKALMHPLRPELMKAGAINETIFIVMALAMTWIVSKRFRPGAATAA